MDFTSSPRFFHLLLAPLLSMLPTAITTQRANWRCHKFTATHHVLLSLFAHLAHVPIANALLEELNDTTPLVVNRGPVIIDGGNCDKVVPSLTIDGNNLSRDGPAPGWPDRGEFRRANSQYNG